MRQLELGAKPKRNLKPYLALGIVTLVFGAFVMNLVDQYVFNHTFNFQSPVVLQSPVIVGDRMVSPVVIIKTVEASNSATVSAEAKKE